MRTKRCISSGCLPGRPATQRPPRRYPRLWLRLWRPAASTSCSFIRLRFRCCCCLPPFPYAHAAGCPPCVCGATSSSLILGAHAINHLTHHNATQVRQCLSIQGTRSECATHHKLHRVYSVRGSFNDQLSVITRRCVNEVHCTNSSAQGVPKLSLP